MPATEQTWRNQKLLHTVFAVTGLILLVSTIWMFAADHSREWKPFQRTARAIDIQMTEWREQQYQTESHLLEHERLRSKLLAARSRPVPKGLLERFEAEVTADAERRDASAQDFADLREAAAALNQAAQDAGEKRAEAEKLRQELQEVSEQTEQAQAQAQQARQQASDEATRAAAEAAEAKVQEFQEYQQALAERLNAAERTAIEAESGASERREELVNRMGEFVRSARLREDNLLTQRKFKSADLDAAKAEQGLMVRDDRPAEELTEKQAEIDVLKEELDRLNLLYQAAAQHRRDLQQLIDELKAEEAEVEKALADNEAELQRLRTALEERRSTYFNTVGGFLPLPGKKWLELPILDAFNSPLKIDNLWSEGLTIDYNFARVRRFDRCTTCHQAIDKTLPGTATVPGYVNERLVKLTLLPPTEGEMPQLDEDGDPQQQLEELYGVHLAAEGLLDEDDVTVSFVQPSSPGARATLQLDDEARRPRNGAELQMQVLQPDKKFLPDVAELQDPTEPRAGLMVGDVIVGIDGDEIRNRAEATFRLLDAARDSEPVQLTVRRGLPNPYTSHPRLDLFVGSLSPHSVSVFGCTSCHEGQGSATAFKWASHTPNDPIERERWAQQYGWFDNPHWIYPMFPERFAESACLKCHHEVSELEPSERFPEAPAPKVTHGFHLIRKYGCYGCHEINGYAGPDQRIGPDLRLEPNFYAVAQQLAALPGFPELTEQEQGWVLDLIHKPEDDVARHRLQEMLAADAAAENPRLTPEAHEVLAPLLKDIEVPGTLRKAGPSLRFVDRKLDSQFLYDWIRNPQHFRPSTRMPQFFGLWGHLEGHGLDVAQQYEPIEILSMVKYLQHYSQPFEYLNRPQDVAEANKERGRILFQERGCLACHTHEKFAEADEFRPDEEIVQGPDLSAVGTKFSQERNENGPAWLYSWIKNPSRYHVRTLMPNMQLDPLDWEDGSDQPIRIDPVADIVAFLLDESTSDWQPAPGTLVDLDADTREEEDLDSLVLEHLKDSFYDLTAERYRDTGIPADVRDQLKGAEQELLVDGDDVPLEPKELLHKKLLYVGSKSISKYGCYGCHDIPGFEGAKPIGTTLADWGRKEPSKLAFEHITQFLHHHDSGHPVTEHAGETERGHAEEPLPEFYLHQVESGHPAGFLFQKLRQPRSYDYHKTENKKYNERLRMPQFPFDNEDREAVATFVLGLVADPPAERYVYQPSPRAEALIQGRQVLEKFNCGGCHILENEKWQISYAPDRYGEQADVKTYPFVKPHFTQQTLQESAQVDQRGMRHATLSGLPAVGDDGRPIVYDDVGDPLFTDENYDPTTLEFPLELWSPVALDGNPYMPGVLPLPVQASQIERLHSTHGGMLAKYLLPHVVDREKQKNSQAKGAEAWGWLPPPLVGEGNKVQSEWLHDFLLDPYPIRPAVVLRMPQFNMSSDEATKLVNYFAAMDNAEYPYEFQSRRRDSYVQQAQDHFDAAMSIVTNNNYCIKCHIVGDFEPQGRDIAKAPNLAMVYQRMRPGYLRDWIANPKHILPYTSMPVNIPYDPDAPHLGGVSQELYKGTSVEQLDALVDLLMNYDEFAKQRTQVSELVQQNATSVEQPAAEAGAGQAPPSGEPAAAAEPAAAGPTLESARAGGTGEEVR